MKKAIFQTVSRGNFSSSLEKNLGAGIYFKDLYVVDTTLSCTRSAAFNLLVNPGALAESQALRYVSCRTQTVRKAIRIEPPPMNTNHHSTAGFPLWMIAALKSIPTLAKKASVANRNRIMISFSIILFIFVSSAGDRTLSLTGPG